MIELFTIDEEQWNVLKANLPQSEKNWLNVQNFTAKNGEIAKIPNEAGELSKVIFGVNKEFEPQCFGQLAKQLEAGEYHLKSEIPNKELAALFFELGKYQFDTFKNKVARNAILKIDGIDASNLQRKAAIINHGRDLINMPANIMNVEKLASEIEKIGRDFECEIEIISGDELVEHNYPLIHAVGKAGAIPPKFVILRKPKKGAKKLAIVGKGVVFDSGGLNIKTGGFMTLMKKDMGGAACAATLFQLLLNENAEYDLSLYVPIVENAISANAMRPGDIINSRKGLSIEIDNTDAEGRLILADALTRASEDGAEIIVDFATLTGAARVALGPELPPFYTNSNQLAFAINQASNAVHDYVWQMPLWKNYCEDLESPIANMKNGGGAFAGSVTAALFLEKFVECKQWVHFDVYCWNPKEKAIGAIGGEIQAVRAITEVLLAQVN